MTAMWGEWERLHLENFEKLDGKVPHPRIALLKPRQLQAYYYREHFGADFPEIGRRLKVGAQRARQLYRCAMWVLNAPPSWDDGLSFKAKMCLWRFGIESREEATARYLSGRLKPGNHFYGPKTHKEMGKWLGPL